MKKALVAVYVALSLSLFAYGSIESRFYVDSADIKIMPAGLFLILGNGLLPIEMVSKDEHGVFVTTPKESKTVVCVVCNLQFDPNERAPYCPHPKFE